jgi:hypothetical protein
MGAMSKNITARYKRRYKKNLLDLAQIIQGKLDCFEDEIFAPSSALLLHLYQAICESSKLSVLIEEDVQTRTRRTNMRDMMTLGRYSEAAYDVVYRGDKEILQDLDQTYVFISEICENCKTYDCSAELWSPGFVERVGSVNSQGEYRIG